MVIIFSSGHARRKDTVVIELGLLTLGDLDKATAAAGPAAKGRRRGTTETPPAAAAQPSPSGAAVSGLIDEAVRLIQRLRAVSRPAYSRLTLSGGRRGVLMELERSGPRTVPQVARARAVTRQHVQALVNSLVREGLVEFANNPEHRRSRLVRLNAAGRDWLAEMTERESAFLDRLAPDVSAEDLGVAKATVKAVTEALAAEAWRQTAQDETAEAGA